MAGNLYLTNLEIRLILRMLMEKNSLFEKLDLSDFQSSLEIKLRKALKRRRTA
jgi:hypothetical protein